MTAISDAIDLIEDQIVPGDAGSITANKLQSVLVTLANAAETDLSAAIAAYAIAVEALIAEKAGIASPNFTGTPTAPTAAVATDSTQIATTAFVKAAISALIDTAPGALDTLNELAAALGDDANFAATMTAALADKLPISGGTLTGSLVLAADPDSALKAATKQYVDGVAAGAANLGTQPERLAAHTGLLVGNDGSLPNTKVTVTANRITLYGGALGTKVYSAFSGAAAITTSGANGLDTGTEANSTWYYIWVIAKADDTKAVLLSTSMTSPTMPADYVFKGLVGAVYNGSGGNFGEFAQRDNIVSSLGPTVVSGGTATVVTSFSLVASVPIGPKAARLFISISHGSTNQRIVTIRSTASATIRSFVAGGNNTSGYLSCASGVVPITVAQTLYYDVNNADSAATVAVDGYEW